MIGLTFLPYVWQGVCTVVQIFSLISGGWIPATVAAVKTDMNSLLVIVPFAVMFIYILFTLIQMYQTFTNSYTQIVAAIFNPNIPTSRIILAGISLLILAGKFGLMFCLFLNLLNILMDVTIKIANHTIGR
jgi:hypothetical protein